MKKIFIKFIPILLFCMKAQAVDFHQELLRRQFVLTGARPSLALHQRLKKASSKEGELQEIQDETLQSEEFYNLMIHRVREMFRVREKLITKSDKPDSFDLLVKDVVQNNRSWDLLFTAKETLFNFGEEKDFFSSLAPELKEYGRYSSRDEIKNLRDYVNSREEEERLDQSLTGLITTSDFFERYTTTKLNKNRKRAAALFRTLLCDDMNPVLLPSSGDDQSLLREALGLEPDRPQVSDHTKHGTQEDCKACHFKLDPAGKTFRGSGSRINRREIPGALALKDKDGNLVHVDVKSLPELIQAMVARPEYVSCQVRHFWNWTIGSNVPITERVESELTQKFNEVGHRPKEFLKYLISRPEFMQPPLLRSSEEIRFSNVKPILNRCTKCHDNEFYIPPFNRLPIGFGGVEEHPKWIADIVKMLDLSGDGSKAKMPPKRANWTLTPEEREALKAWIKFGAPDDQGVATLDKDQARHLIPEEIDSSLLVAKTQFGYTYERYLNAFDFIRSVSHQLMDNDPTTIYSYYYELQNIQKQRPLGISSPATGDLAFRVLNPEVFNSYSRFLKNFDSYLDLKMRQVFPYGNYGGRWVDLASEKKAKIIAAMVDLLRPELIENSKERTKIYNKVYALLERLQTNDLTVEMAMNTILAKLTLSKDYLTLGDMQ